MNGTTSKLLRKIAKTNPYKVENIEADTLYNKALHGGNTILAPGLRLTYKYLKKFYKQRRFTTTELRSELSNRKTTVESKPVLASKEVIEQADALVAEIIG